MSDENVRQVLVLTEYENSRVIVDGIVYWEKDDLGSLRLINAQDEIEAEFAPGKWLSAQFEPRDGVATALKLERLIHAIKEVVPAEYRDAVLAQLDVSK